MTICDRCYQSEDVGEHGWMKCPLEPRHHAFAVVDDTIIGGFVQTNFGHEPEVFYSKRAMADRAKALGLEPMVRHVDGDRHVSRWI